MSSSFEFVHKKRTVLNHRGPAPSVDFSDDFVMEDFSMAPDVSIPPFEHKKRLGAVHPPIASPIYGAFADSFDLGSFFVLNEISEGMVVGINDFLFRHIKHED